MEKDIGFIILRCVREEKNDLLWKECYKRIRKFYNENKIIIIDDNSNEEYIDKDFQEKLYKTKIIKSEFPGRGEFLPYYYFSKNKFFEIGVFIHDSCFINSHIDFYTDNFKFLWHFSQHTWDRPIDEKKIIGKLHNNTEIQKLHKNKKLWYGCFGAMMTVRHSFLKEIDEKHNLILIVDNIKTRYNRMSFERVISCIFINNIENKNLKDLSIFGDIVLDWMEKYKTIKNFSELSNKNSFKIIKMFNDR